MNKVRDMKSCYWYSAIGVLFVLMVTPLYGEQATPGEYVPRSGVFAAVEQAKYLAGELVYLDAVNRRGGLRLDGDEQGRYSAGPTHFFALLPYGMVWHYGALAELRDVPLGTHVHGYFFVPPAGEEGTIPDLPDDQKRFAMNHNHAILLEDDFSFYQRRGQSWKVVSIDREKEKLNVEPLSVGGMPEAESRRLLPGAGIDGGLVKDGINVSCTFDIDDRTNIWQGRRLSDLSDIKAGMIVRFNLGWAQGWAQREFRVSEIWLDDESHQFAAEQQRRRHVQYERERWAPGWIDHVEHFDFGGGIVTLTLFTVDAEIVNDFRREKNDRIAVACAEKTLRTWFHRADRKFCRLVEWKDLAAPPLGSSGIQLRLKFEELLNGYRPGACVRVKCDSWKFVTMPSEDRIKSEEDQKRGQRMVLPW